MSAASGDIRINDCMGGIKARTASGDIDLGSNAKYDLSSSAAFGDCPLDFNGIVINAMIEVTAWLKRNRISAPSQFDEEKVHSDCGGTVKW